MSISRDEIILDKSEYSPLDNHLSYYTKQAIVPLFVENGIFRSIWWFNDRHAVLLSSWGGAGVS